VSGPFRSFLANDLERFLEFKGALGHSYRRAVFTLRSFDRFVHEHARPRVPPAFAELVPAGRIP
jgi:hypothetical protein